jgi:RimJ/RimL family protein N-acetyltransferase
VTQISTARLRLAPPTEDDAAFVLELLNDPGWIRGIGDRGVRTVAEARAYIHERFGKGVWFVVRDAGGERLGMCGLVSREGLDHRDIGYAFVQRHAGQGYATEAARAVLRHGREVLGLQTIAAITDPENAASRRVLEKLGLRYVDDRQVPGIEGASAYFET